MALIVLPARVRKQHQIRFREPRMNFNRERAVMELEIKESLHASELRELSAQLLMFSQPFPR